MFSNQSSQENIDLLSAMRYFYNKAKFIQNLVLFISIILPLVYMGYRYAKNILLYELPYDGYLISGGLMWILIMYFMEKLMKNWVILGAKAQEKFDVGLFQIASNDVLIYDDISRETIYDGAKSFNGSKNALKNWYGDINNNAPHELKVLISQRMNISWGNELKKKYKKFLIFLTSVMALGGIGLAIYFNMQFIDSLIFILFPMIPLFYLAFKSLHTLKAQIHTNQVIDKKILEDCDRLQDNDIAKRCRLYQDYIYRDNRINSILIPNWFYSLFKDDTNDKLIAINNTLLNQYSEVHDATH